MSEKKKLKKMVTSMDELELFFATNQSDEDEVMDDAMERTLLIESCRYSVQRMSIPKDFRLLTSLLPQMNEQRYA